MKLNWIKAEKILKDGGIVVIPTDTLYGLVSSAFDKKAIEKIYKIKNRDKSKASIILISSVKQLKFFNIKGDFTKIFQPKVSILLECKSNKFKYIHKGTGEIAFRLISPKNKNLFNLLNKIGPVVAPSANRENEKPAETIREAKKYFGDNVDYYINSGKRIGEPSTLVRIKDGEIEILRQGVVKIKNKK
jgi:L-threonylcarbamoyladenylate synthase